MPHLPSKTMINSQLTRVVIGALALHTSLISAQPSTVDLTGLSLEELMNIDVVSVSKQREPLQQSAAAVFVLDGETIRRSGITSIPEALRLVPGVQVARIDSHTWAITARGFNSTVGDKLEVLMDGRSLYTPFFSGVFWDAQDTLLEDIDRIEVIRGPGAALWGANAVNGVVNIVTKSAAESQGGFQQLGVGESERYAAWRYGGNLGNAGHYRAYAKTNHHDAEEMRGSADADDKRKHEQAGFRMDFQLPDNDRLTVQGDIYQGQVNNATNNELEETEGHNVIARWSRQHGQHSATEVQFYFDKTFRTNAETYSEDRKSFDLELEHRFLFLDQHEIIIGGGYYVTRDDVRGINPVILRFTPARRTDETWNLFIQDQIDLMSDQLRLTFGVKYENNDYTGDEVQPSMRFSYTIDDRNTVWGAVSRAVRIPNRLDHNLVVFNGVLIGDSAFESEEVLAYELGYRSIVSSTFSLDVAIFYNEYDKLRGFTDDFLNPSTLPPYKVSNEGEGVSQGGELVLRWQPSENLNLLVSQSYVDLDVERYTGSNDVNIRDNDENDPTSQTSVMIGWDINKQWSSQLNARYVGALDDQKVDAYTAVDLSLLWRITKDLELGLIGKNLFDPQHAEFGGGNEIQRTVNAQVTWRF